MVPLIATQGVKARYVRRLHWIEHRKWALDYSPPQLKRMALRRLDVFVAGLGGGLSPKAVSIWRESILGTLTSLDVEDRYQDLANKRADAQDFMILALIVGRFCELANMPLVCDRPPYQVPIDCMHLFDFQPAQIREGVGHTIREIESAGLPGLVREIADNRRTTDQEGRDEKLRRVMDLIVPFLLRYSGGMQIHNPAVRHWVAGNAYRAQHATARHERRAAVQSLENVFDALLPFETTEERPNEAGLSLEYAQIRERADPILKRRYRNPSVSRLSLREKFPHIPRSLLESLAACRPQEFAWQILSEEYGLSPGHLKNLVKRGNLFHAVCAHWAEALLKDSISEKSARRE
ncbi:hypothetical protein MYX77_06670 [Acidobacteriia bacterium AH_259_A11_L15]|nr:hypothetical protein [Acidobacteriia bacterium AH_259_A11_L15]